MSVSKKSVQIVTVPMALLAAIFFGMSTPLSKILIQELNPFLLAGLLYLGAGVGLLPFGIFGLKHKPPTKLKKNSKYLIGIIVVGGILAPVFLLIAIKIASATSVSLWLNLELVATAFLGVFLFKDHLHKSGWIGVIISIIAGVLLSFSEGTAGVSAGILVAIACLCWGFDNHFSALIDNLSPIQSTIIKGFCAGGTNLLIGITLSNWNFDYAVILKAMAVGFVCYGISIVLYIASAQKMGSVRGQIFFSTAPFWAVLFSTVFLEETLSLTQIISGILLMISVLMILMEKHSHYHEHEETEHIHHHDHDDLHHNHHDTPQGAHSHFHRHEKIGHSHPHWPDLHHRHDH